MSTKTKAKPYDCVTCGACCITYINSTSVLGKLLTQGEDVHYVAMALFQEDIIRMPKSVQKKLVPTEVVAAVGLDRSTFRYSLPAVQHGDGSMGCVCLKGNVGIKASCSIYKDRPSICQAFIPGDYPCVLSRCIVGIKGDYDIITINDALKGLDQLNTASRDSGFLKWVKARTNELKRLRRAYKGV